MLVLDFVAAIRRDIPGLGSHKVYRIIKPSLRNNGITVGRDKLHGLLRDNNLLVRRSRKKPKTTNSKHWMKKYPNLIKEKLIERVEQVWVCDLTYICVGYDFNYLSLITDVYSKKIVGYHLHPYLTTEGCLQALTMSLKNRSSKAPLISMVCYQLPEIFPRNNEKDERLFQLLQKAYVGGRYDIEYKINMVDLESIMVQIKKLKGLIQS